MEIRVGDKVYRFTLNKRQLEAFRLLRKPEVRTVLFGGAVGGGKSQLIATFAIIHSLLYPGTKHLIARKQWADLQKTTLESVWKVARSMGIEQDLRSYYNGQDKTIHFPNGSKIIFAHVDPGPGDTLFQSIGGLEITTASLDEAGEIAETVWPKMFERLRHGLSEHGLTPKVLLCSNPTKNWLYHKIYIPWEQGKLPKYIRYVGSTAYENEYNEPSYIESLDLLKEIDPDAYYSRVLGDWHYTTGDSDLFVETDLHNACNWGLEGVPTQGRVMAIDVASKTGSDSTVACLFDGHVLTHVWSWKGKDTVELERLIRPIIAEYQVPMRSVVVDAIGVGQGLADLLRGCTQFKANHKALNGEAFGSLRDQTYYKAAEMITRGQLRIKVPEFQSQLIKELTAHKRHSSGQGSGPAKVTPKDQVSLAISKSPDLSDAFTMAMLPLALQKREVRVDLITW